LKVRYLARALRDLRRIDEFVRRESPARARDTGERIEKRIADLALFPLQGTQSARRNLRQLYVTRTPYIVIYRVVRREVQIVTIVHASQQRRS
jgi:toxin ParE1/3/4